MKKLFVLPFVFALMLNLVSCGTLPTAGAPAAPTSTPVVEEGGDVVVEGNIVPRDFAHITTRTGGRIAELSVKKGQIVQKGAVLARFDEREQAQAALTAASLEELNAQQALDQLNENADIAQAQTQSVLVAAQKALDDAKQHKTNLLYRATPDQIAAANANYIMAQNVVDDKQETYDSVAHRPENDNVRAFALAALENAKKARDKAQINLNWYKGKADPKDIAEADADIALDEAKLANAQREWDKTKDGPNVDDLALAESRLANAKAQVSAAQKALDDLELKAPFAATVVELSPAAGETLLPNQEVALLADLGELYVETNDLTELDVVKVNVGDTATIKPDALSTLILPAKVTEIAQDSGKKGGDVTYVVRLKLEKTDPRLRWGMTVEVRFPGK